MNDLANIDRSLSSVSQNKLVSMLVIVNNNTIHKILICT